MNVFKWTQKLTLVSAISILAVSTMACGNTGGGTNTTNQNGNTSGKTITLRLADNQPATYPTVVGDNEFARIVSEKTNGRIQIKVYPAAQLGDENTVIQQIQLGAIDLGRINSAPLAEYDKQMGVFSLPYLFDSSAQMWKVLDGPIGDNLLSSLSSAKMVGLTYYDSGSRDFYNSKHPVLHPSDLKGLKIRVQQSNIFVDLVNTLGGSATPMAYGEVYNALQTGVIDGAENNWPSYYTTNHYKVAKYVTEDNHTMNPEVLLASSSAWSKLSADDQKIIKDAAVESQQAERQAWDDLVSKSIAAVKANGNVVTELQDVSEWQKAVQPLYSKYGQQYQDLISQIRATQ